MGFQHGGRLPTAAATGSLQRVRHIAADLWGLRCGECQHAVPVTTRLRAVCLPLPRRHLCDGDDAAILSATRSASGSALPLVLARRRMPAHAFAESQNFGGIDAAGSSSEDKDATAALGWSEVLQIQHAPRGHSGRSSDHTRAGPAIAGNNDGGSHEG